MTGLLSQHNPCHMFHAVKGSLQIDIDHLIELFFAHLHSQVIFCDSCVVYQDVDGTEFLFYGSHHFFGRIKIGDISLIYFGFSAVFFDRSDHFFGFFSGPAVIDDDFRPIACKGKCHFTADPTACTCDNSYFSF